MEIAITGHEWTLVDGMDKRPAIRPDVQIQWGAGHRCEDLDSAGLIYIRCITALLRVAPSCENH